MVELKSLGDPDWRAKLEKRILVFAHEQYDAGRERGYEMGYAEGWENAWAIAE